MSLRYYKRIGGNKGLGLNISGSGISSSYRTKYVSFGSREFSIRTGIPGLSFRNSFRSKKDKGAIILIILALIAAAFIVNYAILIIYNLIIFLWWTITEFRKLILRKYYSWKEKKRIRNKINL